MAGPRQTRTFTARALAGAMAASLTLGGLIGAQLAAPPTTVHLAPGQQVLVIADAPTTPPSAPPSATTAPTVAPTPSPSPTATPTPLPTPVGVPVPASIDSTGATNVGPALLAFFATVPNGSTIVFKAGGTYRVDTALKIGGRSGLTFQGNGATLKAVGTGYNENYSLFYFQTFPGSNTGLRVTGFKLVGSSPTPGTFISGKEGQHGVLVDGGSGFEVDHNTFSALYGDAVEVNSGAANVHAHDNTVATTGRNGLSVITGNHVEFDHNTLTRTGYMPFDVEPNTASQPSSFINIHDNATGWWSNAFFAVDGSQTGASLHDITVANNVSTGKSLLTVVTGPGRKQAISFTGNVSDTKGGTASFAHVDGLTVRGNVQGGVPLVPTFTDCSGVVVQ